jgi:type III secretion system (T3SS) SseB-like protein
VGEEFEPANDIELLMVEAHAGRTPMPAFVSALLSSRVFVAAAEDEGEGLGLAARRGRDGTLYVPAFTSRERLDRFGGGDPGAAGRAGGSRHGGGAAASVPLVELAREWPEEVSLVVNPGDPVELVLPGPELRRAAAPQAPGSAGGARIASSAPAGGGRSVPAGTSVMVGDPAAEPEAVLAAVADASSRLPAVAAAYRAQVYVRRPGERPHLAIVLELDRPVEDRDALQQEISSAATAAGAEEVSVLAIDPSHAEDTIAEHVRDRAEPFYRRAGEDAG